MPRKTNASEAVKSPKLYTAEQKLNKIHAAIRKHRRECWPLAKDLKDVGCEADRELYRIAEEMR